MARPKTITDQELQKAQSLKESGMSWPQIAKEIGVNRTTLYHWLVPGWREKHNQYTIARYYRLKKENNVQ